MSEMPDLQGKKASQILAGAKSAFLELGFDGASTDEIARRAGVSKGTLYNYFPDKKTLFKAFVERECKEQARRVTLSGEEAGDFETTLRSISLNYVELMASPFFLGIFRIIVSEAERFPELARAFYDSGPDLAQQRLSKLLAEAAERDELKIDDVDLAAHQFAGLCRASFFFGQLFCVRHSIPQSEINRIANDAVDTFLKIYR